MRLPSRSVLAASVGVFLSGPAPASMFVKPVTLRPTSYEIPRWNPRPIATVPAEPIAAPSVQHCTTVRRRHRVERTLRSCSGETAAETARWQPDVLLVLGGGMLVGGEPGCGSTQRAFAAHGLFEKLARNTTVLFSGHGPTERSQALDAAGLRCALARLQQEQQNARSEHDALRIAQRSQAVREEQRAQPTEAEQMCAVFLRGYPPTAWDDVLRHVRFETRSRTTMENVRFTSPMLRRWGAHRVLVLSSPARGYRGRIDNHASRALYTFQAYRWENTYALGAVSCPLENNGNDWMRVEE